MDEMVMPQTHSMALGKSPNVHLPNDNVSVVSFAPLVFIILFSFSSSCLHVLSFLASVLLPGMYLSQPVILQVLINGFPLPLIYITSRD